MKLKRLETLCALFMIVLTLYVSSKCNLTQENWTALLLTPEKKLLYFFGPLGSLLFCFLLYRFSVRVSHPQKLLCILIALCMPLSLMFVFEPMHHQLQSNLHLLFAYLYFFGINLSVMISLHLLQFKNHVVYQHFSSLYGFILGLCICIYLTYMSINTLFELVFTSCMTLYLALILHKLS